MDVIATAFGVLGLVTMWRVLVCFFPCAAAAIWLLFNLDRPANVVSFIAMLVIGVALGALWQWRHERKLVKRP